MPDQPTDKKAPPEKRAAGNNKVINGAAKVENIPEVHADSGSVVFAIPLDKLAAPEDFSKVAGNGADHGGRPAPAGAETVKTLADYDQYRITKEKEVPKSEAVIMIGDSPVAAAGNITPVTAEGKGGKTAAQNAITSAALSPSGLLDDFQGVKVRPNENGKAIISIDTEQSEEDQQFNVRQNLKRAGIHETPNYYRAYNIRVMPQAEYQKFTSNLFELCAKEFGGIHLAIIDGGADYTPGVNDEAEANALIAFFISLAVKYHCAILIVIHLNENAGKNGDTMPRGHQGRQAVRKGYAQLNITKKGDISTLQVLRARKAGADTPLIHYRYSAEKGYHVTIEAEVIKSRQDRQAEKDEAEKNEVIEMSRRVLAPPAALLHKDLIAAIMQDTGKKMSTAKRRKDDLEGWGVIKLHPDKRYRLAL